MTELFLDAANPSAIDGIRLTDDRGATLGRIGLAIELYFKSGESIETRSALVSILREYHGHFAGALTHYLKVNASRLSRIDKENHLDHYARQAELLTPDSSFDASVFAYPDGKVIDEPTAISMSWSAAGPPPLAPLRLSYLSVYFPVSSIAARGHAYLMDLTLQWATALQATHGSAGYSVLLEHGEYGASGVLPLMPTLKRYPGLDFSDPGMFLVEASGAETTAIKSINWLTVLGDDALTQRLHPEIAVHAYSGGPSFKQVTRHSLVASIKEAPLMTIDALPKRFAPSSSRLTSGGCLFSVTARTSRMKHACGFTVSTEAPSSRGTKTRCRRNGTDERGSLTATSFCRSGLKRAGFSGYM